MSAAHVILLILLGSTSSGSVLLPAFGLVSTLVVVGVYVAYALPRLNDTPAAVMSVLLALAMFVASALVFAFAGVAVPVLPACAALAIGHLGLRAGRAQAGAARATSSAASPAPSNATNASNASGRAAYDPAVAVASAVTRGDGERTSASSPVDADAGPVDARPDLVALGRYRIDRQIGRGAMGAVYLGLDPKIGRPVAVKTMALAQEFDGAELVEARDRFFREAETAGRLRHPDIVTIFDAGEDEGLAFIAMEFVAGHDLQRHTRLGTLLPVPQVLRVVERVAEALAHAHSQGVVHRDIKPANVMVDLDSDAPVNGTPRAVVAVKVTDFGIARVGDASRTRTGMVLGTPSFMSPEQMAGRRVDGRSDLYSLGVMLFQLLTGRLPHHAESMARLMSQIANERAPDIRSIRPELPEALADIVALALEKRPEVRYGDGRQMAQDLQAVQAMYDASNPIPAASAAEPSIAPVPPSVSMSGSMSGSTPMSAPHSPASTPAPDRTPSSLPTTIDPADAFAATVKFTRDDPGHNSLG